MPVQPGCVLPSRTPTATPSRQQQTGVRHTDPIAYWADVLRHLVLPATTLALGPSRQRA
ncbi:MAG: hypothetical protein R3C32_15090 [Chloroflexota bacterium]